MAKAKHATMAEKAMEAARRKRREEEAKERRRARKWALRTLGKLLPRTSCGAGAFHCRRCRRKALKLLMKMYEDMAVVVDSDDESSTDESSSSD
jgi:hypothetical protein